MSDGRTTRWAAHREARRAEIVDATLRAIRRHGAGVGMDDIAASAGTSKTVVYRHFGDKAGLYLAVAAAVDRLILHDLQAALTRADEPGAGAGDPRRLIAEAVDAYLRLVEADPEVYRFVVTRPLLDRPVDDDPVAGLTSHIGQQIASLLAQRLRATGLDPAAAGPWGHGLVGLVRAAADHWLAQPDPMPRADLVRHLTDLAWGGLAAVLAPTSTEDA